MSAARPEARTSLALGEVNAMGRWAFQQAFGDVFHRSAWVAERVFAARPFASVAGLHATMVDAVKRASREDQLQLLRMYASRAAPADNLDAYYRARFGFPLILAQPHPRSQLFVEFERRMQNDYEVEFANALEQVYLIARLRLEERFTAP